MLHFTAAVIGFLEKVSSSIRPIADSEVLALSKFKGGSLRSGWSSGVSPWDSEYLMAQARAQAHTLSQKHLSECGLREIQNRHSIVCKPSQCDMECKISPQVPQPW